MKLMNVSGQNFLSFENFSVNFDNYTDPILITGTNLDNPTAYDSNGSGKTSLLDAIFWCLFGVTSKGTKADAVINKKKKKDCYVSIVLMDDEGQCYFVDRFRKHSKQQNSIVISTADDVGNMHAIEGIDQQTFIDALLGCNAKIFQNAFFFGQGVEKYFAQLTDKHQKEILSELLNLQIVDVIHEAIKTTIAQCKEEIKGVDTQIIEASGKLTLRKNDLAKAQKSFAEFDEQKQIDIKAQGVVIDALALSVKEMQNTRKTSVKSKDAAIGNAQKTYDDWATQLKDVQEERDKASKNKASKDIELTKSTSESMAVGVQLSALRSKYAKIEALDNQCPTCMQEIDNDFKNVLLQNLDTEIAPLELQKTEYEVSTNALQKEVRGINNTCAELERQERLLNKAAPKNPSEVAASWENSLTSCDRSIDVESTKLDNARQKLSEIEASTNPHGDRVESLSKDVDTYKALQDDLTEQVEILKLLRMHREYLLTLASNSGAKSQLLQNVTPFLNDKATHYSRKLMDGNIDITFNTVTQLQSGELRDKFTIDVAKNSVAYDYEELSGGEKRRVNICVLLALKQLALYSIPQSSRLQLGIFDEVFDGMDATGYNNVAQVLKEEFSDSGELCFVVSHNQEMEKHFDNILNIEIQGGISRVA